MMKIIVSLLLTILAGSVFAGGELPSIKQGSTSNLIRIPLYDIDATPAGGRCATDVTETSVGLEINVSTDVTAGWFDRFRQSDDTLEAITTIGTYATPTATKARFEIIEAGACTYELQLPDAVFAVTNAKILTIEFEDAGAEIIDDVFWINLNIAESSDVAAATWDLTTTGHDTAGTFGEQAKTDIDSILADTNELQSDDIPSTLAIIDTNVDDIESFWNEVRAAVGTCDSGSTTTCVDAARTETDDLYWRGSAISFTDGTIDGQARCIRNFAQASDTITFDPATTQAVGTHAYTISPHPACSVWDMVVEDTGTTFTAGCMLAAVMSYTAGEWTQAGSVITYQDSGGNENRVVGTVQSPGFDTITITCP